MDLLHVTSDATSEFVQHLNCPLPGFNPCVLETWLLLSIRAFAALGRDYPP